MTEQSIIERAARAISSEEHFGDDKLWQYYVPSVKAVLTAIRDEPSDAMVEAGVAAFTNVRDIWQAMIDAALAE